MALVVSKINKKWLNDNTISSFRDQYKSGVMTMPWVVSEIMF